MNKVLVLSAVMVSALLTACSQTENNTTADDASTVKPDNKVTVYSARKEHLIKPLFDAYTEKTGVEIDYITDKAGPLLSRLNSEGATSPADLLLTTDVGNLWQAQQQGVLQAIDSQTLNKNVPQYLRDDENLWFGLTQRARTIVYASDRIKADELSTYAALGADNFKGRLCLRTSKKVYNQSLVAAMAAHEGEQKAKQMVSAWVNNLAIAPFSNDTAAMKAVQAGQCDATIVNTYYFGRLEKEGKASGLKIFWPDQAEGQHGVHMNISGAGVTKHAPHKAQAIALLEWLSSAEAQTLLAGLNMEFPVNPNVQAVEQVRNWGAFKADNIALSDVAALQVEAVRIIDNAGYL